MDHVRKQSCNRDVAGGRAWRGGRGEHWKGKLDDTKDDGNAGKIEVRVSGYQDHSTYRNRKDTDRKWSEMNYDGALSETGDARFKICRDRGSLIPDNCSGEKTYVR